MGRFLAPLGRAFLRFVLLPLYTLFILTKIRLEKMVVSARGLVFFLFTNRYVFHAALLLVAVSTIASQFNTRSAYASDTGQDSLLYTLVTQGQDQSIEEPLSIDASSSHRATSYLGATTIQAMPSIDYDYGNGSVADLTIPGTVAVLPPHTNGGATPAETTQNVDNTSSPSDVATTPAPQPRTGTENYTVKSGDTVATIARRFDVNVGTIIWANNLSHSASITPGDVLRIPAESGVLHVVKKGETLNQIASAYNVDASEIIRANGGHTKLSKGEEILVPGATPITTQEVATNEEPAPTPLPPKPVAKPTTVATNVTPTAPEVRTDIPLSTITNKAVDIYQEIVHGSSEDDRNKPADKPVSDTTKTTKLLWPTDLHTINQYYGWAHTGVDLDGDYTNAIYAADDGVVEEAGWNNGGYGLMVMIDHQNGFKTRYGHSSKLFVQVGDHVKRGQVIAMIGTTGRSTGTHLHFEVYVNGVRTNPLAYIR